MPVNERHDDSNDRSLSSQFLTVAGSDEGLVHLPANAAGVLFQWTSTPVARSFSIVEVKSGTRLPVRVKRLAAFEQVSRMPQRDFVFEPPALLFRIEPASGFEPGKRYRFRDLVNNTATEVMIDPAPLDLTGMAVRMVPARPAWRETLLFSGGCDYMTRKAVVQETAYLVPAALSPYRKRILSFPLNETGGAWQGPHRYWDKLRPTPAAFGLPGDSPYLLVDQMAARTQAAPLMSVFAFLEVEDRWQRSIVSSVDIGPVSAPLLDSLVALREAMDSGIEARLVAQLGATPVRAADLPAPGGGFQRVPESMHDKIEALLKQWTFERRARTLDRTLRRLASQRDGAVREAALKAIARVQAQRAQHAERAAQQ